jgi:hypothetical protein
MPWTLDRYPPAMRRMPVVMRAKAIEIANALLEQGKMRDVRFVSASLKPDAGRIGVSSSTARRPMLRGLEPGDAPIRRGRAEHRSSSRRAVRCGQVRECRAQ